MSERQSQSEKILAHLQAGKTLTPMDALRLFGCFRLGGRVFDLRKQGHPIKSELVEVGGGKRVARYSLEARG